MDKHTISIKGKLDTSYTVKLPSSEINKVYIWGYELCKGSDWSDFLEIVNKLGKENQQLKQQLAEKEKEIERLNLEFETQEDWQEKWQKLYDETCNLNQDKISFAIEQLELAKEKIIKVPITDYDFSGNFEKMYKQDAIRQIDNQIKQLKEDK